MSDDLTGTPWRRLYLSSRIDLWCLVDLEDWDWINEHRWNYAWFSRTPWKYYAKRNIGAARTPVYLHREILFRADSRGPLDVIGLHGDHRNGCSLDNRRCNLRWTTPIENRANARRRGERKSIEDIVAELLAQHRQAKAA